MGPELLLVALGYYAATAVAMAILIGLAINKTRKNALIVAAAAIAMSVAGFETARPYWEVPDAALCFAVAGTLAMLVITGRTVALKLLKRTSGERKALAST